MISGSKEQLQQQLEYTLLKTDCHSWWISKMQSGREDTLEEQYAIKFCLKLGKKRGFKLAYYVQYVHHYPTMGPLWEPHTTAMVF